MFTDICLASVSYLKSLHVKILLSLDLIHNIVSCMTSAQQSTPTTLFSEEQLLSIIIPSHVDQHFNCFLTLSQILYRIALKKSWTRDLQWQNGAGNYCTIVITLEEM